MSYCMLGGDNKNNNNNFNLLNAFHGIQDCLVCQTYTTTICKIRSDHTVLRSHIPAMYDTASHKYKPVCSRKLTNLVELPILSRRVVKDSARGLPEVCGWLSKDSYWIENGKETFNPILELLYVDLVTFQKSHNKVIIEPNFMIDYCVPLIPSQKNESSRYDQNSRLPWYTCTLQVYISKFHAKSSTCSSVGDLAKVVCCQQPFIGSQATSSRRTSVGGPTKT